MGWLAGRRFGRPYVLLSLFCILTVCNSVGTMKRTSSVGVRTYGTARQNPSVGLVSAGGLVYGLRSMALR